MLASISSVIGSWKESAAHVLPALYRPTVIPDAMAYPSRALQTYKCDVLGAVFTINFSANNLKETDSAVRNFLNGMSRTDYFDVIICLLEIIRKTRGSSDFSISQTYLLVQYLRKIVINYITSGTIENLKTRFIDSISRVTDQIERISFKYDYWKLCCYYTNQFKANAWLFIYWTGWLFINWFNYWLWRWLCKYACLHPDLYFHESRRFCWYYFIWSAHRNGSN